MTKFAVAFVLVLTTLGVRVARADEAADMKRFLAFMDKITDTVVADKDTCPKMATDLNAVIDANKDVIEMGKKYAAAGKKMPADMQQHIQDDVKKMMPGIQNCGKDKDVQAAFSRLNMGPHSGAAPAK